MNPLSDVQPFISRIQNSVVEALNESTYMPKYIIIVPDKDLAVNAIEHSYFGHTEMMEESVNWLIGQIAKLLLTRRNDLRDKNSPVTG